MGRLRPSMQQSNTRFDAATQAPARGLLLTSIQQFNPQPTGSNERANPVSLMGRPLRAACKTDVNMIALRPKESPISRAITPLILARQERPLPLVVARNPIVSRDCNGTVMARSQSRPLAARRPSQRSV